MKRRIVSWMTALAVCLALLPVTALASAPAANIYWMNGHPQERTGTAAPASPTGATPAVPYAFTARALGYGSNALFSGAASYQVTYEEIEGVEDYGETRTYDRAEPPYVVYTPSAQVANRTVVINIWAENDDGRCETPLSLTVEVGPQPAETGADAALSGLSYQVEGGGEVPLGDFDPDVLSYTVVLPEGTEPGKTVTLRGTPADADAGITASRSAVTGYTESEAAVTVTAGDGVTEQTYTVRFIIRQPDVEAGVFLGETPLADGGYLQISADRPTELTISLGAGDSGYDSCRYFVDDSAVAEAEGTFSGRYPDIETTCSITAKQGGTAALTVEFYQTGEQAPAKTLRFTLGTDPDPATHAAVTFDENWPGGGTSRLWTEKGTALSSWPADPVRSGYTFLGWFTDQQAGTEVEAGTAFPEDATLYAHWEKNTQALPYEISYELDGGVINRGQVTSYTHGTGAVLPTDVTRNGYKFGGWFDNPDCLGEAVTEISPDEVGDKTFYAKWWTTQPYFLRFRYSSETCQSPVYSFSYDGKVGEDSCYCAPGTEVTVTVTVVPREGYRFDRLRFLDTAQNDITDRVRLKLVSEEGDTRTWTFVMQEPELYINPVCEKLPEALPRPAVALTASAEQIGYGENKFVRFNARVTDADSGAELKTGTVQFYLGEEKMGPPVEYESGPNHLEGYEGFYYVAAANDAEGELRMGENTIRAVYTYSDGVTTAQSAPVTVTVNQVDVGGYFYLYGYGTVTGLDTTIFYDGAPHKVATVSWKQDAPEECAEMELVLTVTKDGAPCTLPEPEYDSDTRTYTITATEAGVYHIEASFAPTAHYSLSTPAETEGKITDGTYTITFGPTGGSVAPETMQTEQGRLTELPTPTRGGYRFGAWFVNKGTGSEIKLEEVTPSTVFFGDATVYAHWVEASSSGPATYAITVETEGRGQAGTNVTWAAAGQSVTITAAPEAGYQVSDITVTASGGRSVAVEGNRFTMPAAAVTVTVTFTQVYDNGYADCPRDETCPIWPFTDASPTAWYHDGVHFCVDNGLMEGYGNLLFGPGDPMTRSQLCQILYNLEGRPAADGGGGFDDVDAGAWYFDAVTWAEAHGIVEGCGNGSFGPEDDVTREQFAVILYRYAQARGCDVSAGEDTDLLRYTDGRDVSRWAIPAMKWACGTGIIIGTGDGTTLTPKGSASRAEAAAMFLRAMTLLMGE